MYSHHRLLLPNLLHISPCTVLPPPSPVSTPSSPYIPHPPRPSTTVASAADDHTSCSCSPLRLARLSSKSKSWTASSPSWHMCLPFWSTWRSHSKSQRRARPSFQKSRCMDTVCETQDLPNVPNRIVEPRLYEPAQPRTIVIPQSSHYPISSSSKQFPTPIRRVSSRPRITTPSSSTTLSPLSDHSSSPLVRTSPRSSVSSAASPLEPSEKPVDHRSSFGPSSQPALSAYAEQTSTDGFSDVDLGDTLDGDEISPQLQQPSYTLDDFGEDIGDEAEGLDDLFGDDSEHLNSCRDADHPHNSTENQDSHSYTSTDEQLTSLHDQFLHGQTLLPSEFKDHVVHDVSVFEVSQSRLMEWHHAGVEHNTRMNHGFSTEKMTDIRSLADEFLQSQPSKL